MPTGYVDPLKKNPYQTGDASAPVAPGAPIGPTIPGQQTKVQAPTPVQAAPKNPYSGAMVQTVQPQQQTQQLVNPYQQPAATVVGQTYTSAPTTSGSLSGYAQGGVWNGPTQQKVSTPPTGVTTPTLPKKAPPVIPGFTAPRDDANVKAVQALLSGYGAANGNPGSDSLLQIQHALAAGLTPQQIADFYKSKAAQYGGDWAQANMAGHGANWKFTPDVIAGLLSGKNMAQTGWADPRWGMSEAQKAAGGGYGLPARPYRGASSDDTGGGVTEVPGVGGVTPVPGAPVRPPGTGTVSPPRGTTPAPAVRRPPQSVAAPVLPPPTTYINPYGPKSARPPGYEGTPTPVSAPPTPTPPPAPTVPPPAAPPRKTDWVDPSMIEVIKRGLAGLFPGMG